MHSLSETLQMVYTELLVFKTGDSLSPARVPQLSRFKGPTR